MNRLLLSILLCLGLAACSTTGEQTSTMDKPKIEEPPKTTVDTPDVDTEITKDKTDVAQPVTPEPVQPKPKPEPEVKPEPKPKPPPVKTAEGKLILGSEEWVYIPGLDQSFKSKIDSGATTSSISAVDVVPFEREGKDWVKFRIEHNKISSQEISLPILRWAKIKQANSAEAQKRPVITAWIQVGDIKEKADFTLTDRKHLEYPVILGQSFFRDIAIVDVSRKFVQPKKK